MINKIRLPQGTHEFLIVGDDNQLEVALLHPIWYDAERIDTNSLKMRKQNKAEVPRPIFYDNFLWQFSLLV